MLIKIVWHNITGCNDGIFYPEYSNLSSQDMISDILCKNPN